MLIPDCFTLHNYVDTLYALTRFKSAATRSANVVLHLYRGVRVISPSRLTLKRCAAQLVLQVVSDCDYSLRQVGTNLKLSVN